MSVVLASVLVLAVGCGEDDETDAVKDPAGTDTGVAFVDLPDAKGAYVDALDVYQSFEQGRRQLAREAEDNELLDFSATAEVRQPYLAAAEELASAGQSYAGEVSVTIVAAKTKDTDYVLDLCIDGSDLEVPEDAPEILGTVDVVGQRVTVSNLSGPWRVTDVADADLDC